VLGKLARQQDKNVLIGFDKADDAGVYQLDEETALVQTVDFFTPIVDDPYTFGQIAAVNALSDVYAMGGRPMTALAMVCFPEKQELEILERILAGGLSKMVEAGCTVIGGHSIRDEEIKFGYAVTGTVHPKRVLANAGARAGDALILTKALGTGVISTAIKKGTAQKEYAAVHAATDVTGFGLVGHAREMALASEVTIAIEAGRVPLLEGAMECVRQGAVPGGLKANREFAECAVRYEGNVSEEVRTMMFDPQTAGGLLLSVAAAEAQAVMERLGQKGVAAARIGEVSKKEEKPIVIR